MKDKSIKQITINIMEELVTEEVARQIKRYPDNISQYINQVEVATYALNRLPPLYASCHKGLNKQKLKGKSDYSVEITKAVRQGFAAVQKDVLRYSTPLVPEANPDSAITQSEELVEARKALAQLAEFFPNGQVSWQNLVRIVKPLLIKHNPGTKAHHLSEDKSVMWY
jgi:hypothetical protein